MKKIKYFAAIVMVLSTFVGLFPSYRTVQAQEGTSTPVAVDVQVYLAMYGSEPAPQSQISYDIIQTDPQTNEGTVVYRFRSNEPSSGPLMLEPGNYKFRLYDGGNFQRDGLELSPARVEQTIATLSQDDINQGNNLEELTNPGELILWEDGTVVLDVPFTIELGDNLLNDTGDQYATQLIVTVADQESLATLPDDDGSNENPTEESGILIVQVVGDDSSFVSEAVVEVNGESYTTDAQGLLQVDGVPTGDVELNVLSVPEDYSTENIYIEPVTVTAQQTRNTTIMVEHIPEEATTNTVTITVVDEASQPVPNVSITLNEREIYTDVNGQVFFNDVPIGEAVYTVNSVPEGYALEQTTGVILVNAEDPAVATINLATDLQTNHVIFNVVNKANEPVSGVEIAVADNVYTTGEMGQITTDELTIGGYSYEVTSVPEGYAIPQADSVNIVESAPTEKTITLTELIEYGSVLINVTDQNQQPIIGAELTLDEQTFITNGSGQAIINDLVANQSYEYYVSALPEGYVMDGEAEIRTIEVLPNQQVEDTLVINQAEQMGAAVFTILDEAGQPVPNIEIEFSAQRKSTDASGIVQFDEIGPGTYNYQVTNLPDEYEGPIAGQITIIANEETNQEITLTTIDQFRNVTFKIEDQDGSAVQQAQITLNDMAYTTDEAGQVIIEGLNAGQTYNYTLTALPDNYSGQTSGTVTIEANGNVEEVITVERQLEPGTLTITVIDQNDQPVSGAVIQLNNEQTVTTNEQGQSVFNELGEGTYEYSIQSLPDHYEHNVSAQSVYIAEGVSEARQLQVQYNAQPGTVIFNVLDQDDHPVEGAVIAIADTTITTNTEGTATKSDLAPNNYTYAISELPEGYNGNPSGEVTINEDEVTTVSLKVEREVELSTAKITVLDQNNQAVSDVTIAFGGLSGTTNADGIVNFENLEPGRYNYSVTEVPNGYNNNSEAQETDIEEGSSFEDQFTIEKLPGKGTAVMQVLADNNQPIQGVQIRVDGTTHTTDSQGNVSFEELTEGTYSYHIIALPEGVEMAEDSGEFEVKANETTNLTLQASIIESSSSEEVSSESSSQSQSSSVSVDESQSLSPAEQASIDEEALAATRQFIDPETGIEVWVNPQDAANIESITVEKLESAASLENTDSDIYQITLLNKDNKAVQLTRIAEVKIPTRPVNSQIRVIRLNDNGHSNLTFALHNQRVTFRTQQLGTFAIVYNPAQASSSQEASQSSVSVSVESSVEEKDDDLPNTGETSSRGLLVLVVIALLSGVYLLLNYKKATNNE